MNEIEQRVLADFRRGLFAACAGASDRFDRYETARMELVTLGADDAG